MKEKENPFLKLREGTETDEKKALTQKELAEIFKSQLGIPISQSTISKLENDGITIPDKSVLKAYREYFSVSTDFLLGFTEYETNNIETQKVCFLTGLSERSYIVLNYLKKFKGMTESATGLVNYSSIQSLNRILETYYESVLKASGSIAFESKKGKDICIKRNLCIDQTVETLFSLIDNYFNSQEVESNTPDNTIHFQINNVSIGLDANRLYEVATQKWVVDEIERIKEKEV